jgi:hypothetical protein
MAKAGFLEFNASKTCGQTRTVSSNTLSNSCLQLPRHDTQVYTCRQGSTIVRACLGREAAENLLPLLIIPFRPESLPLSLVSASRPGTWPAVSCWVPAVPAPATADAACMSLHACTRLHKCIARETRLQVELSQLLCMLLFRFCVIADTCICIGTALSPAGHMYTGCLWCLLSGAVDRGPSSCYYRHRVRRHNKARLRFVTRPFLCSKYGHNVA